MKRKRKGEREEKETPPAWEQTVNILFMHGVIAQGKRAPGGGGFDKISGYTSSVTCRAYSPLSPTLFRSKTLDFTWVEAKKQEGLYLET